jgi:hypothetical protein
MKIEILQGMMFLGAAIVIIFTTALLCTLLIWGIVSIWRNIR